MLKEKDEDSLFFESCAVRMKKLSETNRGYLKFKITELFYNIEMQQANTYAHRQQGIVQSPSSENAATYHTLQPVSAAELLSQAMTEIH